MTIEEQVVRYYSENGLWLASAESCTGGLISKRITDVSGSSAMFGYGLCTYANEAKNRLLGVSEDSLALFGAVSEQVAAEMAAGLLKVSGADVVVCTTGIAGPGGGSKEKPVGLVYLGVGCKMRGVRVVELRLGSLRSRDAIRSAAADRALEEALLEAERLLKRD